MAKILGVFASNQWSFRIQFWGRGIFNQYKKLLTHCSQLPSHGLTGHGAQLVIL